ncbi:major facilitator superfamily domain-containing protein [Ilyonectria destructans]|uniref:Major facilitator superfamily domain-containing protein n=1 Tax=Dactylonectria estremocensis TaxID=1079267 RepID=A0A9P9DDJ0_9HYPO|nr:major facilitator superfamily domain-containing protein [Ilyonectria destructans]KAH7117283.1 major facilitator superfamily domain-containing protein [Dactylonectria estremocensis]
MDVSKPPPPIAMAELREEQKSISVGPKETTRVVITFENGDPENPYCWSKRRKHFVVFTTTLSLFNSTLASSLPGNAMSSMAADFGVSNAPGNPELALPISLFLVGYIFGPLLFAPLSELHGRRRVVQAAFVCYTAFTLGCALSSNWTSMLVFRLLSGTFASAPAAIGAGIIADIYSDLAMRGRVLTYFFAASTCAPLVAPTIAGYVSQVSWRWAFWVGLILAGVTWLPLAFLPETFGPVILARRARAIRKAVQETGQGNPETYAAIELDTKDWNNLVGLILVRPLHMLFTELIVASSSVYMALAYSVYFMYFQTYPIVFKGIYEMSIKMTGLMYLPIIAGVLLGLVIFLLWDAYYKRCKQSGRSWAQKTEYSRLPLACIGGLAFVISLFWLGWTARPDISWALPFMSGVPFGIAELLISIALTNYLADSYGIFSASAMAAGSSLRNLIAAGLPLATAPMYTTLGVGWATSVLGFVALLMSVIPFVFIRYGDVIRARSVFYQKLKAELVSEQSDIESG